MQSMPNALSITRKGKNCIDVGPLGRERPETLLTSIVEEKYEKEPKSSKGLYGDKYDEDSDSSSDEDEDDEGFLATEALDAQISATLQAIRSKDPRVYDEKVTFY